jgi:hypothetical protein
MSNDRLPMNVHVPIAILGVVACVLWVLFPQVMVMLLVGTIAVVAVILTLGFVAAWVGKKASDLNERHYNDHR